MLLPITIPPAIFKRDDDGSVLLGLCQEVCLGGKLCVYWKQWLSYGINCGRFIERWCIHVLWRLYVICVNAAKQISVILVKKRKEAVTAVCGCLRRNTSLGSFLGITKDGDH